VLSGDYADSRSTDFLRLCHGGGGRVRSKRCRCATAPARRSRPRCSGAEWVLGQRALELERCAVHLDQGPLGGAATEPGLRNGVLAPRRRPLGVSPGALGIDPRSAERRRYRSAGASTAESRDDHSPAPGPSYFWVNGHWRWENGAHVWVPGRWEASRPSEIWVPAHWVQRGGGWVYVGWQPR
jgi:hypothetical protein